MIHRIIRKNTNYRKKNVFNLNYRLFVDKYIIITNLKILIYLDITIY